MSLKSRLLQLTQADRVELLDVAANATFRHIVVLEIAAHNADLTNLVMPAHTDGAVQFLAEYRQLRRERDSLQELLDALQIIQSDFTQGD